MNKKRLLWLTFTTSLLAASFNISFTASPARATEPDVAHWGYIDPSGKLALKPQYLNATSFHDGLAAVQTSVDEKWGFIDKTGKMVIAAQFDKVQEFSEGLAAVKKDKWGFIDKTGKFVIEPSFEDAGRFNEGLAPVAVSMLRWGFIDKSGALKIEAKYPAACEFVNDRAGVLKSDGYFSFSFRMKPDIYDVRGGHWNYINKKGETVVDSAFECAGIFGQGLAPVAVGSNQGVDRPDRWGFINESGKLAIKPQFNDVHAPSEDSAAAQFGTWKNIGQGMRSWVVGKWGYINLNGKKIIAPQFDAADRFSEGLASVLVDDKWGFIDKSGKIVIKPEYKASGEFHEQLAPVLVPPQAL